MLVNAKKILKKAKKGKYAVPQFNINNLEWTKAILEVAQNNNSPVILGCSEGAVKYMGGFREIAYMVKGLIIDLRIKVPVVLHLDHGSSVENCKEAIRAGYTSVMFDGSLLPLKENLEKTREVVEFAKRYNVSVEAEVGTVGGSEDGPSSQINYATFEDCKQIVNTGINMLAASLGSVHGHYHGEPKLGFKEMKLYSKKLKIPLVLHGGSGIPDIQIKKAIESGESKININTELQEAFSDGIRQYIEEGKDKLKKGYDPRQMIMTYAYPNMKKAIREKIILFNSINKA